MLTVVSKKNKDASRHFYRRSFLMVVHCTVLHDLVSFTAMFASVSRLLGQQFVLIAAEISREL